MLERFAAAYVIDEAAGVGAFIERTGYFVVAFKAGGVPDLNLAWDIVNDHLLDSEICADGRLSLLLELATFRVAVDEAGLSNF